MISLLRILLSLVFRLFMMFFAFIICAFVFVGLADIISGLTDDFNRNLPRYSDKVEYVEGGFDDFEEYKEFYYSKDKIAE
ncbi:MAG: hypothetical protein IJQ50_06600, partial [Clostridia bacterium]|nr:hypothetical protein [Clostridia bacterium]